MSALGAALEAEADLIKDALHVFAVETDKGLEWRRKRGLPQDVADDSLRNRGTRARNLRAAIERLT
jgi:hypothetical protein